MRDSSRNSRSGRRTTLPTPRPRSSVSVPRPAATSRPEHTPTHRRPRADRQPTAAIAIAAARCARAILYVATGAGERGVFPMFARYLKSQLMVLLCGGLVGPIFLIVYFAIGPMSRAYIGWMFYVGLLITAADVLVALWLANYSSKSAATTAALEQNGVLALAQITGMGETG